MRFNAKLLDVVTHGTMDTIGTYSPVTEFSKSQIFISPLPSTNARISIRDTTISNGVNYSFDKYYDDNEKLQFRITLRNPDYVSRLKLNWINKIKCNLIHRRYLFQRDPDWFWKAIITAFIGFIFSLIGFFVGQAAGYRQGYQTGLREGQATHQK